jgi:hypothetical protein
LKSSIPRLFPLNRDLRGCPFSSTKKHLSILHHNTNQLDCQAKYRLRTAICDVSIPLLLTRSKHTNSLSSVTTVARFRQFGISLLVISTSIPAPNESSKLRPASFLALILTFAIDCAADYKWFQVPTSNQILKPNSLIDVFPSVKPII